MEALYMTLDTSLILFKEGLCYLRVGFMIKLSDFNFDQSECHIAERIPLSCHDIVSSPEDYHFEFDSCGNYAYCAVIPISQDDETHRILKLDVTKRSWVHVFSLVKYNIERMISCNGRMFLVTTAGEDEDWMIVHLNTD